jgi:hypothetical protein
MRLVPVLLLLVLGCQAESSVCSVGQVCTPEELSDQCPCDEHNDPRTGGSVVVRWRLSDATGRLFGRGVCCSDTPPWLVRSVRLVVIPQSSGAGIGGSARSCIIPAGCGEAELATAFCLKAGDYDLQLQAAVGVLESTRDGQVCQGFAFGKAYAHTPPAVRRTVLPGQVVNLDAILLRIP